MPRTRNQELPQLHHIPVRDLLLDTDNPRFPTSIQKSSQGAILDWMIRNERVDDLIGSIGAQGYFPGEPLLVAQENDKYIVIEGNRRLAALKLLNNPELAESKKNLIQKLVDEAEYRPEIVPVLIYDNRDSILQYLGYRHVTGIKSWGSLEKSRYLHQLSLLEPFASLPESEKYQELARAIGSKSPYVRKLFAGFELYNKIEESDFYDIQNLNEQSLDFSLITTAIGYPNIATYIGLNDGQDVEQNNIDKEKLESVTRWIFEKNIDTQKTRLGESRNLKVLNAVLGNDRATKVFVEQGYPLLEAEKYTDEPTETYKRLMYDANERIKSSQDLLSSFEGTGGLTQADIENIRDMRQRLSDIRIVLQSRLNPDDDI